MDNAGRQHCTRLHVKATIKGKGAQHLTLHVTVGVPPKPVRLEESISRLANLRDLMGLTSTDPNQHRQNTMFGNISKGSDVYSTQARSHLRLRKDPDNSEPTSSSLTPATSVSLPGFPSEVQLRGRPDDRPVAYMISAKSRFTEERQKQLEDLGFRPERIDPVFLEHDCEGGDNGKKKAMWGIMNAHQNAWKQLALSGRRGLVLESDWGIGDQKLSDLRSTMSKAAERNEHYVSVGWCRQALHEVVAPWKFTCATAYFLSVEAATNLSKLRHDDGVHAPCFPVDSMLVGACKDRRCPSPLPSPAPRPSSPASQLCTGMPGAQEMCLAPAQRALEGVGHQLSGSLLLVAGGRHQPECAQLPRLFALAARSDAAEP